MTENDKIILLLITIIELIIFIYLMIVHIIDYAKYKQKKSIKGMIYLLLAVILSLIVLSVTFHVPAFLY